ncbi:MAG: hypothetical protein O3A47_04120 [Chloroflexi bacterium]|nr:hypothetical protein [Chloroflexota bacterium]
MGDPPAAGDYRDRGQLMCRWLVMCVLLTAATAFGWGLVGRTGRVHTGWAEEYYVDLKHFWDPGNGGGTNDLVGTNNVIVYGTTTTTSEGWDVGTSNANYVQATLQTDLGQTYTIMMWVRPDVSALDSNGSSSSALNQFGTLGSRKEWQGGGSTKTTHTVAGRVFGITNGQGSWSDQLVGFTATDDAWYHIAWTSRHNGATWEVETYINGVTDGPTSATAGYSPGQGSDILLQFAGTSVSDPTSDKWKFHGAVDKIRLYDAEKTEAFIQSVYDAENKDGH